MLTVLILSSELMFDLNAYIKKNCNILDLMHSVSY